MFRARFKSGDNQNSDDYSWNGNWVSDLAQKLEDTCINNHIANKNLYKSFELNKYNASLLLSDGLHPNDLGYERLFNCIENFIYSNI